MCAARNRRVQPSPSKIRVHLNLEDSTWQVQLFLSITVPVAQRDHLDRMLGRPRQLSGRLDSVSSVGSVGEGPCPELLPSH